MTGGVNGPRISASSPHRLEDDPQGAAGQPYRSRHRQYDGGDDCVAPRHGAQQADHHHAGRHNAEHGLLFRVHADAVDDAVHDGVGYLGGVKHLAQTAPQHDNQADQRQK